MESTLHQLKKRINITNTNIVVARNSQKIIITRENEYDKNNKLERLKQIRPSANQKELFL